MDSEEINFKSDSILQNYLVRYSLHSLVNCKFVLSLVDVGFPTKV